MKLIIGVTKKIGQPGFGSAGATCQLESSEFAGDLTTEGFQRRVRRAFDLCREAVDEELRKQGPRSHAANGTSTFDAEPQKNAVEDRADQPTSRQSRFSSAPATAKQLNALRGMAAKRRLSRDELDEVFGGKPLEALSLAEASQAIDRLKNPAAVATNGRHRNGFAKGGT